MQKCKSIVAMVFECYFFNQLLHCNVWRCGLHCIVRNEDVCFTRGIYYNERIIHYTIQEVDQFPYEISGSLLTWFTCVLSGMIVIRFSSILPMHLKACLHKVHRCYTWLVSFKEKMKKL